VVICPKNILSECGNLTSQLINAQLAVCANKSESSSPLPPNHHFFLCGATDNAASLHEDGALTAEVKSMNTNGIEIGLETTNHLHVVMRGVEKNLTQSVANGVETEVRDAVAMMRINVKRAKGALQCILA